MLKNDELINIYDINFFWSTVYHLYDNYGT